MIKTRWVHEFMTVHIYECSYDMCSFLLEKRVSAKHIIVRNHFFIVARDADLLIVVDSLGYRYLFHSQLTQDSS